MEISPNFDWMLHFTLYSLYYSNINLLYTVYIDLAVDYIAEGNSILKLSKADLTKLFSIATSQNYFIFMTKFMIK